MQDREQDRTEQATPFKIEESRKRGEVQRSVEVTSFALILALLLTLLFAGELAWRRICAAARLLLEGESARNLTGLLVILVHGCLQAVLPFGLAAMVLALLGNWVQTGPLFTLEPLRPRFERIHPIRGFQRLFTKRLLFDTLKNILKLALLGGAAYLFFAATWRRIVSLGATDAAGQLATLSQLGLALIERLAIALLMIAILDVVFVRWQYRRQMMMSRRELREEIRRREGDPHVRARQRELQRDNRKQSRSLSRVREADVLITNPDHVGVALRYERERMSAPHLIAKGAGLWVMKMKLLAWRHSIPVREQRSLARHLFRFGMIDRPVPPDTYLDVARLYAELDPSRRRRPAGRYEVRA